MQTVLSPCTKKPNENEMWWELENANQKNSINQVLSLASVIAKRTENVSNLNEGSIDSRQWIPREFEFFLGIAD